MLCAICVEVLETQANFISLTRNEDDPEMQFVMVKCGQHRTLATLMASSAEGCLVCKSFCDLLTNTERLLLHSEESTMAKRSPRAIGNDDGHSGWLTTLTWTPERFTNGSYALISNFASSDGHSAVDSKVSDWRLNHYGVYVLQPVASTKYGPGRSRPLPRASNTDSLETWLTATDWLDDCLKNHKACNAKTIAQSWYPTRLIDVGERENLEQRVRLVSTADAEVSGPYCTMSHCWGKIPFLKLTRANRRSLCAGVLLHDLPTSFRDAILACRRLGVRFIWIDSLCIMQDDLKEWSHESSLMHLVYSNSHLNLSASASADSSQGFYRNRQPRLLHPTRVDLKATTVTVESGVTTAHNEIISCEVYDSYFWDINVLSSLINKRGWVFQERLLAPRVLSFGSDQIFWECREQNACELYPEGLPSLIDRDSRARFKSSNLDHVFLQDTLFKERMDNALSVQALWGILVEVYSTTSLTFPGDKLIAISGVAQKYHHDINDDYVAGMWRKDLANWILWYVRLEPSPRPLVYRAPSWSWASVDGMVGTLRGNLAGMLATVDNVVLHHVTEDTFGSISGGWLDLTGPLKAIQIVKIQSKYRLSISNTVGNIQDKDGPEDNNEQWPRIYFDEPPENSNFLEDTENGPRLFCMICRVLPIDPPRLPVVMALLVRLIDAEKGIFTRFGVAVATDLPARAILLADIDDNTKKNNPCLRYANGMHTIRII